MKGWREANMASVNFVFNQPTITQLHSVRIANCSQTQVVLTLSSNNCNKWYVLKASGYRFYLTSKPVPHCILNEVNQCTVVLKQLYSREKGRNYIHHRLMVFHKLLPNLHGHS